MRRRSLQLASIGLSSIALLGTVSFPVHAQASEDSESPIVVPSSDEIVDNNDINLEELADAAVDSTENAVTVTEQADDINDNTLVVVSDESSTDQEAYNAMGDAEDAMIDADDAFFEAQDKYDAANEAYNDAVNTYNQALDEYNSQKQAAQGDLDEAQAKLDAAEAELKDIESQLETYKQELVDAGATALVSAGNSDQVVDVDNYISAVIQYFYIPKTENLTDGSNISNYSVTIPKGVDGAAEDYVIVSYDVCGSKGEVLRTGYGEYTYSIDAETGEVKVATRTLTYEYTDKDGQVVSISKDDAEALNGQIAIDENWTVSGEYVPRYVDRDRYVHWDDHDVANYTEERAIAHGESSLENGYAKGVYNVDAVFNPSKSTLGKYYASGFKCNQLYYDVYYDQIGQIWTVSNETSTQYFESEDAAYAAILKEAQTKGAATIDYDNSPNLNVTHNTTYSDIVSRYVDSGLDSDSQTKVQAYSDLIRKYQSKKTEYSSAAEQVAKATEQIAQINSQYSGLTQEAIRLSEINEKLETAKSNIDQAQENYNRADDTFWEAYTIFDQRFMTIGFNQPSKPDVPDEPTPKPADNPVVDEPVIAEPVVIEDEIIVDDVILQAMVDNSSHNDNGSYTYTVIVTDIPEDEDDEEELPEDEEEIIEEEQITNDVYSNSSNGGSNGPSIVTPPADEEVVTDEEQPQEEITIEEEEAPKGITVAGIMERGKWFVALGGVAVAGIGVAAFEFKRRAAMKILDKLNQ